MLHSLKQRNCQGHTDHCRHLWLKTASYCRKRSEFDNGTNFTKRFVCQQVIYLPSQDFEMDFEVDFKVDLEFKFSSHPMKGNLRRSWILDSTLWISRFQYWIPIVGGIQDSLSQIPDSKDQDSVFHKRICSGFRILQTKLSILTFEQYASCFRSKGFVHYSSLLHLEFRYRCYLRGCGRLCVRVVLEIYKKVLKVQILNEVALRQVLRKRVSF